jgi:hypothetical protein
MLSKSKKKRRKKNHPFKQCKRRMEGNKRK